MAAVHKVLLVEDERNTRERFADAIAAHESLALQAAAATCAEARRALDAATPDVLLTDLGLPDGDGVELIREVRRRGLPTQCMVITVFGDEKHVVAAIEAGALGYLLKDGSAEYIARSVLDLVAGGSPISPQIARYFLKRFHALEAESADDATKPRLTDRENEVLRLIVKGFSYAEAARLTGVAESTITSHVRNIYRKLEVHSRGEAVYEALQLGIVKLDE
ncbi:MAG: response regulator transcription factor [Thermodesulfobacteriota bacterium]